MGLILVTPPAQPVMSLDDAKLQCRAELDEEIEDDLIAEKLCAAVGQAQDFLSRPLLSTVYRYTADGFPGRQGYYARMSARDCAYDDAVLRLPIGGVTAVSEIGYIDGDGVAQILDPSQYQLSTSEPLARIAPGYQSAWPAARAVFDAVHVNFTAGFGATPDKIPAPVIAAVKLILAHLYANRESTVIGSTAVCLPDGAEHMLWPYRVFPL